MSTIHSKDLPDFIEAESPRGLRRLMFKVNAKAGANHKFFDISSYVNKKGKLKFIAWFFTELSSIGDIDGD